MRLDNFDRHVLSLSGKAQELMREIYGVDVSAKVAQGHIAGIRHHLQYKERMEGDKSLPDQVSYKFAEDGSKTVEKVIVLSESEMNDPSIIMEKMGLDPLAWELVSCELDRKAWQVTMRMRRGDDEDGNKLPDEAQTETNYAFDCKVRVKPIQGVLDVETVRSVFNSLKSPKLREYKYKATSLMLEAGMYEPHFGKHAWEDETLEENYDIKIAEETYCAVIDDLIGKITSYNMGFDSILFPIGQDFFHIDNKDETTTLGTRVGADGRWQKIYETGIRCLVWAIESLRKFAPVHVIYVPGNHDEMLAFFATLHMDAYFRETDSVTVDTSPAPRKYHRFGQNLIGFSHGKEGKRIEKLMQVEAAEDWGKTKYREFHLGDLHHERVKEDGGIIFRRISSITATDAWHTEKGFKGAVRKAQAFVWDKERGLTAIINSTV